MNRYGAERRPFVFLADYAMQACVVEPLEEIDPQRLLYAVGDRTNAPEAWIRKPEREQLPGKPDVCHAGRMRPEPAGNFRPDGRFV